MHPYKPDDDERRSYYYGLPSEPQLIARTSAARWAIPRGSEFEKRRLDDKQFRVIGQHKILQLWSDTVRDSLVHALKGYDWRCLLPIRLGYSDEDVNDGHPIKEVFPVVLLVAFPEFTLGWERAIELALACRTILQKAGIDDVEVELMQGTVSRLGQTGSDWQCSVSAKKWGGFGGRKATKMNEYFLPVLPQMGCTVSRVRCTAPKASSCNSGTVGLYLRLSPKRFALVSRHVAVEDNMSRSIRDSLPDEDDCHGQERLVMECPSVAFDAALKHVDQWSLDIQQIRDRDQKSSEAASAILSDVESIKNTLIKVKDDDQLRCLGHVAFSPEHDASNRQGFMRDWALIELNDSQCEGHPENKLVDWPHWQFTTKDRRNRNHKIQPAPATADSEDYGISADWVDAEGFLKIRGVKVWDPQKRSPFRVAKQGSTSGHTYGTVAELEATIRSPSLDDRDEQITRALCIVTPAMTRPGYDMFAETGDFGSCVFDLSGQAVAMVDAGLTSGRTDRKHKGIDVTFATPMQWILEDIEAFTGEKPVVI